MKWICCQLGAREHYAIPRALYRKDALRCLITDAWRFRARWHQELRDANVTSFNWALAGFEFFASVRRLSEWRRVIARNRWFQRKAVGWLSRNAEELKYDQVSVFAYSYAAREILRFAKKCGWKTVLGQIDPGPIEEKIVAEEAARVPQLAANWQPAPTEYWNDWREECDLADRILVNSEWSRGLLEQEGVSEKKLRVVPLAFNQHLKSEVQKQYPRHFTKERPLRVLFLGQVNLRKGAARLLEAARKLRAEPVEFWMVGPLQISDAVAAAGNSSVRWTERVTRENAVEYYHKADVFILPTLSDGFGLTQLEALARKVPVIASTNCGTVVRDGVDGILLSEPTSDAIARALFECLRRPERLAKFSRAAQIRNEFTLDSLGDSLSTL